MFSIFFINRPIFAAVISIVIVICGGVALTVLPIARYPDIAPPTVEIKAAYPGANAAVIADTVAATIEKEVNGVEGMIYMSSVSANDGSMTLTVSFAPGTDLDTANVLVQNRVAVAESRLPEEVKRQGVTVKKKSTDTVLYVSFYADESGAAAGIDDAFLGNYVALQVRDELARVDGVGDVSVFSVGEFSMRLWLDPQKLKSLGLVGSDVVNAVREQNVQVAAGRVGAAPVPDDTAFEYVINLKGRLMEVAEFEDIIVRTGEDGSVVRLRDVARVELGSDSYSIASEFNGKPSATIAIYQVPGSNVIAVREGVVRKLGELAANFPRGLTYKVVYDMTDMINASIREVVITLFATLVLVVLTVYLFLQSMRATLVPAVTIPVSLIGTFGVLLALGFSLNILTLFGLVLVIGIVVDDAIVVVENATVHLEKGLSPKEAASEAMKEVAGPVIATTLVLLAVFVPTIFMPGITGTLFKQFAVTISVATAFSSINALTLSPALCGIVLRARTKEPRGVFRWFNTTVEKSRDGYLGIVRLAVRKAALCVVLFAVLLVVSVLGLGRLPGGFVPQEDEGYCFINVQLPDGATLERTKAFVDQVGPLLKETPGVRDYIGISGFSILDGARSSNAGMMVVTFEDWSERPGPALHQSGIVRTINKKLRGLQEGIAFAFPMPSIPGIGTGSGFTYMLQDRGGVGLAQLSAMAQEVIRDGNSQTGLERLNTVFRASTPQLFVDIDRDQVKKSGTSLSDVFNTLQVYLGSSYVNDFTLFGRVFKVTAQSEGEARAKPEDIAKLEVRGAEGGMIPIGALADVKEVYGPQTITRFNLYPSVKILGSAAPGFSSGEALDIMEDMSAKKLPATMGFSWSEMSFQEKQAGGAAAVFFFAIVMVYLVLAAQYESWSLPVSVALSVPTALLGALIGLMIRGYDFNVYTQIGIVLLIGLATKSAILIVEFAKAKREEGMSIFDAAIEATKLRFRAVLMTAFSFILGVIPLLIASGAGAESRKILGTTVFSGMVVATAVSLAAVPMLYYVIQAVSEGTWRKREPAPDTPRKET